MTPFRPPSSFSRATDRMVSIDSCFAVSMKPHVLTTTTSASSASFTTCRPSSTTWPRRTSESTRLRAQPRLISETRIASFTRASRPPVTASLRLLLDDPDLHRRVDRRVQVHRNVEHADLLERLLEADLLVVDRDALLAQRGGDVRAGDRAEQVAF